MTELLRYEQALAVCGSPYRLKNALKSGALHKVDKGLYSTTAHPDSLVITSTLYPNAVITMDSAFYAYGLTDVIPDEVHLVTDREASRIRRPGYRQYFTERPLLDPGAVILEHEDGPIRIYSRERMLVELMRRHSTLPLDYYKEIIGSYRRIVDDLDIRLIEDYLGLFERNDYMFDILQREVF